KVKTFFLFFFGVREGFNTSQFVFCHLCPIAEISLHFLSHSQTGIERKSRQIKGISWGPPGHQNECPHWKIFPLLLFWGQPHSWDFLLLSLSIIMVNRTNRGKISL
ncbi:unnamed protein product, partial [Staurois parvus]